MFPPNPSGLPELGRHKLTVKRTVIPVFIMGAQPHAFCLVEPEKLNERLPARPAQVSPGG